MWGIIIAVILYAIAIAFNIAKEGMRANRNQTEWSMEEIEKIKGSAVFGWKMLIVVLFLMGAGLIAYSKIVETDPKLMGTWIQCACGLFTAAVISIGVLLYAKKNPQVYKIICIMKPEKEIRPTVAQRVEQGMKGIWEDNFSERKPDMTDFANAYYKAKEDKDHPTTEDMLKAIKNSEKKDDFELEREILEKQIEKNHDQMDEKNDLYYREKYIESLEKYNELLEKYTKLLEKYNELKQDI